MKRCKLSTIPARHCIKADEFRDTTKATVVICRRGGVRITDLVS